MQVTTFGCLILDENFEFRRHVCQDVNISFSGIPRMPVTMAGETEAVARNLNVH